MELSDILNSLSDDSTSGEFSKTAADASTDALSNAIDRALNSGLTKEANYSSSPSADLVKMASRIADAENASLVKEAEVYGAAVADGFMSRIGSATPKQESVDSVKLAFDQGYADTINALAAQQNSGMDKVAAYQQGEMIKQAAFEEGYNDLIKEASYLEKTAASFEEYGFNYGNSVLASL